ncbi:MAG: 30S ribosomal protein S15 [Cyclobacteriaceae bacterium]|nr:30S ribosomal protein S15 [Cyclobacteriaceae bacterium]
MYLNSEKKQELFNAHGISKSKTDTGSPESQIALFTYRIKHLTEHLKDQRKDFSTQTGLLKLVGKRKKLLNYLQKVNIERYRAVLTDLNLRK